MDTPTPLPHSTAPITRSRASSTTTPAIFKKPVLKVPERERGQAETPLKFSAMEKKRQRELGGTASTSIPAAGSLAFGQQIPVPVSESHNLIEENKELNTRYRSSLHKSPIYSLQ